MSEQLDNELRDESVTPRVSIGLPVYNGENYLEEAVDSILGQTYTDFELIISDNASTDRTEEICRRYADEDKRVRYFRHVRNRGASPNYNFTVEKARGEYFKWAAHDDVLHPTFLEEAVRALDADPAVSLAYSKTRTINEHGEVVGNYDASQERLRIDSKRPQTRFGDLICVPHNCVAIFGLVRTDFLTRTNLHAAFQGADRVLLAEMALLGPMHQIPEYLFDRRDHPSAYSAVKKRGSRIGWWDVDQADRITFPNWRRLEEYLGVIRRANLPPRQRLAYYAQLVRWLFGPRWYRQRWLRLFGDGIRGAGHAVIRVRSGIQKRT